MLRWLQEPIAQPPAPTAAAAAAWCERTGLWSSSDTSTLSSSSWWPCTPGLSGLLHCKHREEVSGRHWCSLSRASRLFSPGSLDDVFSLQCFNESFLCVHESSPGKKAQSKGGGEVHMLVHPLLERCCTWPEESVWRAARCQTRGPQASLQLWRA